MLKKIIGITISMCLLLTIWVPIVGAANIVNVSNKGETKISVELNSNSYAGTGKTVTVNYGYASMNSGNWIELAVNFLKDGKYQVLTYACTASGKSVPVSIGIESSILGSGAIESGSSWSDFTVGYDLGTYNFAKGNTTLRLTVNSGAAHVAAIALLPVGENTGTASYKKQSGPYRNAYIPTEIFAENYDVGTLGSYSVDGENKGGKYRKDEEIDIYESNKNFYVALNPNEFLRYTFNVVADGVYAMDLKASGSANLEAYFDDKPYPVNIGIDTPSLAVNRGTNIYLREGVHTVKFAGVKNAIMLDEIIFTVAEKGAEYITVNNLYEKQPLSELAIGGMDNMFDFDSLDKENNVYKTIYLSENGSDDGDGSKTTPFKTVTKVLEELEKTTPDMTGDIVVSIESGYYEISETIKMNNAHSGKNGFNVIWRGANVNDTPILSGGKKVEGWEKVSDFMWRAPLDDVSYVRNLYVNDYPSIRARTKYLYTHRGSYIAEGSGNRRDGFYVSAANFPKVSRPEILETVWESYWAHHRHLVEDIIYGEEKHTLIMKQPLWKAFGDNTYSPIEGGKFYLENAKEFLDEPGEFFYDDVEKYIYYYPYKAEDMTTANTYIGKTELMMDVRGESKDDKVSNIVFDNISFKYGAWDYASENGIHVLQADACINLEGKSGYVPGGAARLSPGQLTINNAENITIKNCQFACLGSSAIDAEDAVRNVKIEGNLIKDISGAGIMIGTWNHSTENGSLEAINGEICKNFMVKNNVIRRVANEYASQTAISTYYESDIYIMHNDIADLPYTGITAGWGWETTLLRSKLHKNIFITHNKISHVLKVMTDGAQIYTLGEMPGSVIAYNYLTDSHDSNYGGVYHDAGSSFIETHHNVSINNPRWYFIQSGYKADNDKAYSNYSDVAKWTHSGTVGANSKIEEAIIINPYDVLPEAQAIIDEAGVEGKYRYLLDNVELPIWRKDRSSSRSIDSFTKVGRDAKYGWLEAEDYMPGKNGETYYKLTDEPKNNPYRNEGVSLMGISSFTVGEPNGYVIQKCYSGEWTKYKLLAPADGEYEIKIKYAHGYSSPSAFNLYIDDTLVLNKFAVAKGGKGWAEMVELSCGTVNLSEGEHTVKFEYAGEGFYLDALGFINENIPLPEKEVEVTSPDYDEGVLELEKEVLIEPEFMDIGGHWAQKDILDMKDRGIINGLSPTEFGPDNHLSRYQAILMCLRAYKIAHNDSNWEDIAIQNGIIDKKGTGNEIISREEFAHIIMKLYTDKNKTYKVTMGKDFNDKEKINSSYYYEILGARELGIIKGDENGNFRPKDGLTRAEAIVTIKRLLAV